jgi:CheY-like chemotaxis protein
MSQRNPKLIDVTFPPRGHEARTDDGQPVDMRTLMNQLQQTAFELRQRLTAVEDERNILAAQVQVLQGARPAPAVPSAHAMPQASNDLAQRQLAEQNRTIDGLRRSLSEAQSALEAAQGQLSNLRMARDSSQSQNRELTEKLAAAEDEIAELRYLVEKGTAAQAEATDAAEARREALQAKASLEAAQKRIEALIRERDETTDKALRAELELETLRERCRKMEEEGSPANPANGLELEILQQENQELTARLEAQRLETIDLATRFQITQEQIKNVSASLAEARLQARAHRAAAAPPPPPMPTSPGGPALVVPTIEPEPAEEAPAEEPAPALVNHEPFNVQEAQATLKEIRRCYQAYARETDDLSHLNELHCAIHTLALQAARSGLEAYQRISDALATLVQDLYKYPEQINTNVLNTVVQSIEFLSAASKLRDLHLLRSPSEAAICVVDDDPATCECILMAMEGVEMEAEAFRDPAEALCELSNGSCDLIITDVQMPGMDGFELCAEVRQRPHHQNTPVLFVTGQTDPEIRNRSVFSGGNDFMTKPFLLCELGLKALVLTAKAQLHMA